MSNVQPAWSNDCHFRIEPRWTDFDAVGHVNNTVYLTYAEEARSRFLRETVREAWGRLVVVHNSIDYHLPVELTDAVEVTSAVERVGVFAADQQDSHRRRQLCAAVRTVQVVLRDDRSGSRPWTAREKAALKVCTVRLPITSQLRPSAPGHHLDGSRESDVRPW